MGDPHNQFGWSPVGARVLREYSQQQTAPLESAPTVRYAKTWTEIKALPVMQQLLSLSVQQMVMLHAVDAFPKGRCRQVLARLPPHCYYALLQQAGYLGVTVLTRS